MHKTQTQRFIENKSKTSAYEKLCFLKKIHFCLEQESIKKLKSIYIEKLFYRE